jgi:lysophospholipase L1-like esterase
LLAIGDSIIAGVGARQLSQALVGQTAAALAGELNCRIDWTAHGFIGANSTNLVDECLPALGELRADMIITSIGVNDVTSLTPLARWRRNVQTLLDALARPNQEALIAFAGLPPLGCFPLLPQPLRAALGFRAGELDRVAREVVNEHPRGIYVPIEFETSPEPFSADGYHPSEASYTIFGETMAGCITARFADTGPLE